MITEETKRKISETLKGNKNGSGNKGKSKRVTLKVLDGIKKRKISMKGNKNGIGNKSNSGRKLSIETRKKMSESRKGDKSNLWKGGISYKNYSERKNFMSTIDYKLWRSYVFERDNWTCQTCSKRGSNLHAHHIKEYSKYPELRLEVDNGVTLCRYCHILVHTKKETKPQSFG